MTTALGLLSAGWGGSSGGSCCMEGGTTPLSAAGGTGGAWPAGDWPATACPADACPAIAPVGCQPGPGSRPAKGNARRGSPRGMTMGSDFSGDVAEAVAEAGASSCFASSVPGTAATLTAPAPPARGTDTLPLGPSNSTWSSLTFVKRYGPMLSPTRTTTTRSFVKVGSCNHASPRPPSTYTNPVRTNFSPDVVVC